MNVLLIAEHCNPEWTSVPLVSWYYYCALRERVSVHLVTQVRNRDALIGAGLAEGEAFTAVDSERVARPIWRLASLLRGGKGKGWTTAMAFSALSYYYFEHLLWKKFRSPLLQGDFDIVHRLTPLSPAVPSTLARRCKKIDVPFVIGPMNGGLPWPKEFKTEQKREREWLSNVRGLMRCLPRWKSTYRDASCVLSGSKTTYRELEPFAGDRNVYMHRNGVDVDGFSIRDRPGVSNTSAPLRLIFVGRLVPLKGCDMLLEAIAALAHSGRIHLTFVGDGPERERLQEMCTSLKIEDCVTFAGNVSHVEIVSLLGQSDVFVFPSIREFGGAVVLEAMSCGLPVIVINYGGPGELATEACGILVPLGPREGVVHDIRSAIMQLADDRQMVYVLGQAGRQRAESTFDWSVKAVQLVQVYEWVTGRGNKPHFESTQIRPAKTGTRVPDTATVIHR